MDKLGDMDLFVRVVRNGGLAAAGREVGLSPASMTARMKALEARYGVRLLNRTTRRVTLTEEGREFLDASERILADVKQTEARIQSGQASYAGSLKITVSSDLGRQHILPVLSEFVAEHPEVKPYLHLSDGLVNLVEDGFDLAIRHGSLEDSRLIAKKLASNRRVLCASPDYIKRKGEPTSPDELIVHDCLTFMRLSEPLTTWHFHSANHKQSLVIRPARMSNDGALIRQWAVEGAGIALKSIWEISSDLKAGSLVTVLNDFTADFHHKGASGGADIYVVYPDREFLPHRTRGFIDALATHFKHKAD